MNTWQEWVTVIVGFVVAFILRDHFYHKQQRDKSEAKQNDRITALSERLTKVESELVTDKEVREVLKEFFYPFIETLTKMQKDLEDIKLSLAEQRGKDDGSHAER